MSRAAHVTVSVGATPFACFALPPEAGDVSADRLLATTTLLGGYELCRIAVREGIIGRAIDGSSLRARLAERASQPLPAKADMHVSDSVLTESEARRVLLHLGAPAAGAVLIGGRADYPLGFSASRRASFPDGGGASRSGVGRRGAPGAGFDPGSERDTRLAWIRP